MSIKDSINKAMEKQQKKEHVPEHMIRDHQLIQGRDEFDENGMKLRHASQAWHEAYRCWNRIKRHVCSENWDWAKRTDQGMCYWCPKFADDRNELAAEDGIRYIPPKRMSSFHKPVDSNAEQSVPMSLGFAKCLENMNK